MHRPPVDSPPRPPDHRTAARAAAALTLCSALLLTLVDWASYAAFPSGHAMTATVVCGLLLWLLHRYGPGRAVWRTALAMGVVSVLGVGLTRVWLGVHWPSDVVGGWLLGAMLVALA